MIELDEVSKTYNGVKALDATTFSFPKGKSSVLIGPSGCGKSTVLRLVNGLIPASTGSISIDGMLINSLTVLQLRRRMGYVIQDGGLFPHFTALENIILLAVHVHKSKDDIFTRVEELCKLAHFDEKLLERYPFELSGGQRQRVSLMRALMLDPDLLLLDEPLAALDPMVRAQLQVELKQIFSELKKTVILVTHDLPEAAYFGDLIVLMNKGAIIQTGKVEELQTHPKNDFVKSFIEAQRQLVTV